MRHSYWLLAVGAALLCIGGCHKKPEPGAEQPMFTNGYSSGPTGDAMARFAQQYGVPIYPGSVPDTTHFNAADSAQGHIYLAYSTSDSTETVLGFYKAQLHVNQTQTGNTMQLAGTSQNGTLVTINVGRDMNGSRTDYSIIATSLQQQNNSQMDSPPTTVAATPQPMTPQPPATTTTPPPQNQDSATYDISTANAPPDVDDNQNGDTGDQGTDNSNGGGNDNGGQDNGGQDQSTGGDGSQTDGGPPGGG